MLWLMLAVIAGIAGIGLWAGRGAPHELLRNVYSPSFTTVPDRASIAETLQWAGEALRTPQGTDFLTRLLPDQAGALWIMLLVAGIVALDVSRPAARRNIDLALSIALALAFFDVMRLARMALDPITLGLIEIVFAAAMTATLALIVRAVWRAWRVEGPAEAGPRVLPLNAWTPNLRGRPLAVLASALVVCNVAVALARPPDDAGYFTNLGAQRLRERVRLPYGDPLLTGTPGAAYGPILYAVHVPFQWLVDGRSPNPVSSPSPPMGEAATYLLPSPLATKLTTLTLHLVGLMALWAAGRRLTGQADVGWSLVALYASSAFVLGVGGDREFIGGITFISHIGPTALTLIAFACLHRPALAGTFLALGTGAGFYPAFMLPAWTAFFWREKPRLTAFLTGFMIAAAIIGLSTLALSRPAGGRGRIGTVLSDTFGHHTDPNGYGRSVFGFWGQRPGIRAWLTTPLAGASGLTTPAYGLFFGLVAISAVVARKTSPGGLALLTAAIAFAASAIKVHSTASYVAWAYPFLLIGLFADRGVHAERG